MMREETARKIEALKEKVGNEIFCERDVKGYVSISTLRKYGFIASVTERKEVSLDELIAEINEMIGEDCYGMEGWYEREEDKIFYCNDYDRYRFIK